MAEKLRSVRIRSMHWEARDVVSLVLCALNDMPLPLFEPGSHIDVNLPNGLIRSYSLSNDGIDGTYRITVARDANSTGGSIFINDQIRPGDIIKISDPRNNFSLCETADLTVFIAGGIGITPFLAMAGRLNKFGRKWKLYYSVRSRDRAALLAEFEDIAQSGNGKVVTHYDEEAGGALFDISGVIADIHSDDHVYCCGPAAMLESFRNECARTGVEDARVHFEYFKGVQESEPVGGFQVTLTKSGRTIQVPEGATILEAVEREGIEVPHSCMQGVCGACETRVLDGTPDHRDMILTKEERASGGTMMICCSRSLSDSLSLDL